MANNRAVEYLKFANLQMASEAFLNRLSLGNNLPRDLTVTQANDADLFVRYVAALTSGNTHASRFTLSKGPGSISF